MKQELHVFEPDRAKEYTRILIVRTGAIDETDKDAIRFFEEIFNLFGKEWASSHNRVGMQNIMNQIITECAPDEDVNHGVFKSKVPEHLKMKVLNFGWKVFKCAWINANEYIKKE